METVTLNELMTRLHEPGLIILDVRPALEYTQGYIAGARSIPICDFRFRMSTFSQTFSLRSTVDRAAHHERTVFTTRSYIPCNIHFVD